MMKYLQQFIIGIVAGLIVGVGAYWAWQHFHPAKTAPKSSVATTTTPTTSSTAATTSTQSTTSTSNSSSLATVSYTSPTLGFSLKYPSTYTLTSATNLGPASGVNNNFAGVKLTVPTSLTTGTNLNTDSYVSVEQDSSATSCTAAVFLPTATSSSTVTDAGNSYETATVTDAAAGNQYEETVYVLTKSSPCMAVRYFIHSGNIANYTDGTTAFDHAALIAQFDAVRHSLLVSR